MRALVVAPQPFFTARGTPFSVYYRTLILAEAGVSVDLLTYGEGEDVAIPGVRIIRIPRVPGTAPVPIGPSWRKALLDLFLAAWTAALLARHRYDFVHAHEESVFFCRILKPLLGFRLVYDMHSSLPQQLRNFRFTSSRTLIRAFEWLERAALRGADAVLTICPALADYARARMPDPTRHILIENSIFDDVRYARPRAPDAAAPPLPVPHDRPVVLYAGTFEPYQGLDILVPAFALARARCPDAFLVLVGGTSAQVAACRRLASAHGLDGHCLVAGRIDPAAARELARRAAVLTSPRSAGTNTPLKIYEQLASGVPLVATRIPAHTQVLDDEVCFLVDPTPEAMAEGLVAALTDPIRRERVTRAARQRYEHAYSRDAYREKIARLLELVGGAPLPAGAT